MVLIYFLSTIFYYFRENRKETEKNSIFSTFASFGIILSIFSLHTIGVPLSLYYEFVLIRIYMYYAMAIGFGFSFIFVYTKKTKIISTCNMYKENPKLEKIWRVVTLSIIISIISYLYFLIWFQPNYYITTFNVKHIIKW